MVIFAQREAIELALTPAGPDRELANDLVAEAQREPLGSRGRVSDAHRPTVEFDHSGV